MIILLVARLRRWAFLAKARGWRNVGGFRCRPEIGNVLIEWNP
ncbi:hypothetical protein [Neogemmobacter tilapiae]|nr:hypothetical protein [Gemmobacter tilapiae]